MWENTLDAWIGMTLPTYRCDTRMILKQVS